MKFFPFTSYMSSEGNKNCPLCNSENYQPIRLNCEQIYFLDVTQGTKKYGTEPDFLMQKVTYTMFYQMQAKKEFENFGERAVAAIVK